jgi:membrane-associated protein
MEFISSLFTDFAPYIPLIGFTLLILAGFNLPISEDLVFLISGALAAAYTPNRMFLVFAGCFAGAYVSDIVAYSIGRFGGRRLLSIPFIRKLMNEDKVLRMETYFERYGGKTLFFGRFIPFGVRNIIFMTAGFSKISFPKFLIIDIFPLSITSSILFYLGISLGENFRDIIPYMNRYKLVIGVLGGALLCAFIVHHYRSRHRHAGTHQTITPATLDNHSGE